ncbi:hypothetical protein BHM03_00026850 [Ensete ventricosum]|nr:hypothetical protein BHM03_00026850 [Ensete ventricosum]
MAPFCRASVFSNYEPGEGLGRLGGSSLEANVIAASAHGHCRRVEPIPVSGSAREASTWLVVPPARFPLAFARGYLSWGPAMTSPVGTVTGTLAARRDAVRYCQGKSSGRRRPRSSGAAPSSGEARKRERKRATAFPCSRPFPAAEKDPHAAARGQAGEAVRQRRVGKVFLGSPLMISSFSSVLRLQLCPCNRTWKRRRANWDSDRLLSLRYSAAGGGGDERRRDATPSPWRTRQGLGSVRGRKEFRAGKVASFRPCLGGGDVLYEELWRACAGPLVEVPRADDRVFYFPQGHIEQVKAFALAHARHKREQRKEKLKPCYFASFPPEKIAALLTVLCSCVIVAGGVDESGVESADSSLQSPFQDSLPRRRCSGENGELRVGVRCLARQRSAIPASVISSQSMHLGVLAAASHAVTTNTLFTVYYKPRVIISYYLRVEKFHVIDLFCFLLAEPTAALWYSGTNKPHEMLSFTGTDAENLETHDAWPCIQKERKGIDIVIAPSSHDQVLFDGWFREVQTPPRSSPSVPTSLNLFQEKNEETKCAAYTNCIEKDPSLKLDNGEGELRKPEGGRIAYRLFGIDLFNHTNCTADTDMVIGLPYGNSDQKPGFSKSSKEQKQSPEDNSKEIYGRHNCSGRSRTKVSE